MPPQRSKPDPCSGHRILGTLGCFIQRETAQSDLSPGAGAVPGQCPAVRSQSWGWGSARAVSNSGKPQLEMGQTPSLSLCFIHGGCRGSADVRDPPLPQAGTAELHVRAWQEKKGSQSRLLGSPSCRHSHFHGLPAGMCCLGRKGKPPCAPRAATGTAGTRRAGRDSTHCLGALCSEPAAASQPRWGQQHRHHLAVGISGISSRSLCEHLQGLGCF